MITKKYDSTKKNLENKKNEGFKSTPRSENTFKSNDFSKRNETRKPYDATKKSEGFKSTPRSENTSKSNDFSKRNETRKPYDATKKFDLNKSSDHKKKYDKNNEYDDNEDEEEEIVVEQVKNYDDTLYLTYKSSDFENLKVVDQLARKQEVVNKLFQKEALPIIANPIPRGYRHKAVLSALNFKKEKSHQIRLGFFEEGTKNIKPKLGHFLHDVKIDEIFKTIEALLIKFKFKAYAPNYKEGIIKHVLIRKSYAMDEFMVVFSTQGNLFPNAKDFVKELLAKHPNIKTVVQNIHRKDSKFVVLEEEKILYGRGYIQDKIGDLVFNISPRAFYQINPAVMMKLYGKAIEMADIKPTDIVLDCYSGIGTLTLLAAQKAKMVYGLEINDASVKDAIMNKKENKINNVQFILGDVENTIDQFTEKVDVLIMDPTRQGATHKFIQSVLNLKPERIVYISCDPETQFRDIRQLTKNYTIRGIQPVDMFTYTTHVETITLLSLKTS